MRVDLFELLDGLFKGVVYFFYNLFETIYNVLRRPFRGPTRLYRAHRNPRLRQIAAITFLFIGFLAFYVAHLGTVELAAAGIYTGEDAGDRMSRGLDQVLLTTPSFSLDGDSWWPIVAATLVSTIVLDALLRLSLRAVLRRQRSRREFVLGSVEYALFLPIALATLYVFAPDFSAGFWFSSLSEPAAWPLLFLPPILLALVPAAALLASGLRRRRLGRAPRAISFLIALTALSLFTIAATRAGAALGLRLTMERSTAGEIGAHQDTPDLLSFDCKLSASPPHVELVMWNRLDRPVVQQRMATATLTIASPSYAPDGRPERIVELVLEGDNPPSTIVLAPGETRLLRYLAPGYASAAEDQGRTCLFTVSAPPSDPYSADPASEGATVFEAGVN